MPPVKKSQVFKAPDGKEFTTRAAWRDYMMVTYYSFKNKVNEPEPLVKAPGSIDGQMFDIADCENSTLVIMDHTEQIQMDELKSCKVLIGACTSSIFIRNCTNCTFYTCCRQLRLRDVTDCTFYIYSMAEVHIEYSTQLRFAPFNGGYPEHKEHLKQANLNISHNLWYDIYDHNDPGKTHEHWSLLPESEYEEPWFPAGPCEPAIPRTKPGSVKPQWEQDGTSQGGGDSDMQSFSLEQMKADAERLGQTYTGTGAAGAAAPVPPTATAVAAASAANAASSSAAPPPPAVSTSLEQAAAQRALTPSKPAPQLPSATAATAAATAAAAAPVPATTTADVEAEITQVLKLYAEFKAGEDLEAIAENSFLLVLEDGTTLSLAEIGAAAPTAANQLWTVSKILVLRGGDTAAVTFWATVGEGDEGNVSHMSATLQRVDGSAFGWKLVQVQRSATRPFAQAPPPYYA